MTPTDETGTTRQRLSICGIVQAVGFRPFVFALAEQHGLRGWVCNAPDGVTIEIEGPAAQIDAFRHALTAAPPAHARIDTIHERALAPLGERQFEIRASARHGTGSTQILPDLATCDACLEDLLAPASRRFRYPFVSCTQCGPRWSIVERLPFDRDHTAMRDFPLCARCQTEHDDPRDRRFHAQTNCCPDCGPQLTLRDAGGAPVAHGDSALREAVAALQAGRILAIKGLGGFQLLVNACDADAIARLRRRKQRPHKPLAVMFPDLDSLQAHCHTVPLATSLLTGVVAPIVLLPHRGQLPDALAPGNPNLGAMLPYTPLHHVLLRDFGAPLVATSGNRSGEPLCSESDEAVRRLAGIADGFLTHDRRIVRAVDDSVVQISADRPQYLRRARGAAPLLPAATPLPHTPDVLAVGAHLKNSVAIRTCAQTALGAHIGDLDTPQAVDAFDRRLQDLQQLYGCSPATVAHDKHPDYHSSSFARAFPGHCVAVQHHHAHIVATMVEHGLSGEVLGVAWDGNGLGDDGTLWGGEFLRVTRARAERLVRLRPFPLPGGERAMREPRRSALGILHELDVLDSISDAELSERLTLSTQDCALLRQMLARDLNSPLTSAAGRLFDAMASLLDLHPVISFEGQAAMALQFAAERGDPDSAPAWPVPLDTGSSPWTLDWGPMVMGVIEARRQHQSLARIAARVHQSLAHAIAATAVASGRRRVALGGGCFQNRLLLELTIRQLRACGCDVYWPQQLPPNDGGLSAGQLGVALAQPHSEPAPGTPT